MAADLPCGLPPAFQPVAAVRHQAKHRSPESGATKAAAGEGCAATTPPLPAPLRPVNFGVVAEIHLHGGKSGARHRLNQRGCQR